MSSKNNRIDIPQVIVTLFAVASIFVIALIFIFVFYKAMPTIKASGFGLLTTGGFDMQISEAFYNPAGNALVMFGMLGLILGTLLTSGIALIFASVLGLGASITIVEFCGKRLAALFTNIVRLLAAIPSVVFGLIGLIVVVPLIEKLFITVDMQIEYLDYFHITGRNMLSSAIVLTFMIAPTIVSLSIDAINAVPNSLRGTGFAFGMSHFRVIWKIVLPYSRNGILAGVLLGAGRGIGEAIAVSMVCGGVGILPKLSLGMINLLAPTLPLSAAIINKSEAMGAGQVASALFTCGAILLVFGAILSITARVVSRRLVA
jgi:phosphate ABC transporter permease protein PstC